MSEWISVKDRLPREIEHVIFDSVMCLVTDGIVVSTCSFDRGHGCGKPWADWSRYGGIPKETITHWMAFPEPPAD